jgi:hypothetical protein
LNRDQGVFLGHSITGFLASGSILAGNSRLVQAHSSLDRARACGYARSAHGFDPDLLAGEWVDGILGNH